LRDLRDGADTWPPYVYDADEGVDAEQLKEWGWAHRPSIHLPRKASRITLEVTAVRCEQLQQITTRDAIAEGVEYDVSLPDGAPTMRFHYLWDSIHVKDGFNWKANPFVFVVSFKRISP
jgi:hypothetical protein